MAACNCCKRLTDALIVADNSSDLQLAVALGASLLDGLTHCALRKGGTYEMRYGAACSDVPQDIFGA